jgi:hypothetical protein
VIVDFHGWVVAEGPWLGVTRFAGALLRDLAAGSWRASAIFLTGCLRGAPEFAAQMHRVLASRTTVVSHWREAAIWDHTPVQLVKSVLGQAAGGDGDAAFTTVAQTLLERQRFRDEDWTVEQWG